MPRGRPSIITQDIIKAICKKVQAGNSLKSSATSEGIMEATVMQWQHKGKSLIADPDVDVAKLEGDRANYVDFVERLTRARGRAVTELKDLIRKAAEGGDWRAAQAMGKSMYPEEFRTADQVEVSGPEGGPVQFEPDLSRLEDVIRRTTRGDEDE